MSALSCSATGPRSASATAAGTKVSDSTSAAVSASTTVMAIGWNILPSTPVSANTGRYTAVMMPTPNSDGRITSLVASNTTSSRSAGDRLRPPAVANQADAGSSRR